MKINNFISIQDVSNYCNVEITVLREFAEYGLITVQVQGKIECVLSDEVQQIRRIIRLYKELGVNKEGIDIILAMRNQIQEMHKEMAMLQQKLDRLENDHKLRYWEIPREMGLIIDYEDQ